MSVHRIAILGAGALGSYVGARLAQAGCDVLLIGRAAHVDAINAAGLRLREAAGDRVLRVRASTGVEAARDAELVLVCVKSADTEAAAHALRGVLPADALLLSLQNGVTNGATLARELPQRVAAGLAYVAASLPGPGTVLHSGGNDLVIGGIRAAQGEPEALAALLAAAAFQVRTTPDITLQMWNKLIVNCAWNAISALTQAAYGPIAAVPEIEALQRTLLDECVAVARAEGQAVSQPELQAAVERVAVNMAQQRSSTAQDLARGRATEIAHLNGHIVERGRALGIATPANQALLALVLLATSMSGQPAARDD